MISRVLLLDDKSAVPSRCRPCTAPVPVAASNEQLIRSWEKTALFDHDTTRSDQSDDNRLLPHDAIRLE